MGEIEPVVALTYGGFVTDAQWTNTPGLGVFKTTLSHTAVPFSNYMVMAMPYSTQISSNDNDCF